jgi:hypothetical protein
MNGYNLLRAWYNFKFDNPAKAKAIHSDMYCYLIDLWNRLGQKDEFGLPTSVTMEALGIGSYNTYKKTLNDLIEFGFIRLVVESKNQHQSKIVALSNIDKATDKPLDKAHIKATDKATDTINKQYNKRTNKQDVNVEVFIEWFNSMKLKYKGVKGKFKTLNNTDINNLQKLKQLKYDSNDWEHAFKMMCNNKWVIDNDMITPTHYLINANFQKYMNQVDKTDKIDFVWNR